jgi:hypothetical protein
MTDKTAKPELGTFENPKFLDDSRPEPLFQVKVIYNGGEPETFYASGVDLRDGCFLCARPRMVTRKGGDGKWWTYWQNEVFKFLNIVEVVDLTITHLED